MTIENDLATGESESVFTAEEQSAMDAYERGEDVGSAAAPEATGGDEAASAAAVAPEAAAAAGEAAAAPGDVIDPDDEGADDPVANNGRFVRHGAFHKERMQRKEAQRQVAELQEKFARGDERMRVLMEAMQRTPQDGSHPHGISTQAEPVTPPDPSEDIFGYVKHLEAQLTALSTGQQRMTADQKAAEEARAAQAEVNTLVSDYQRDVARVAQAEPHFVEAYQHLMASRVAELKLYGLDDRRARETAEADELALIRSSKARGVSPAETVFALAKQRGFQPKAAEPAPDPKPQETAAERAERVAKGQAASKSLSAAGGAPAGEVTLEMLAGMSEADFEKFSRANPRKLAELMGA